MIRISISWDRSCKNYNRHSSVTLRLPGKNVILMVVILLFVPSTSSASHTTTTYTTTVSSAPAKYNLASSSSPHPPPTPNSYHYGSRPFTTHQSQSTILDARRNYIREYVNHITRINISNDSQIENSSGQPEGVVKEGELHIFE